MNTLPLVRSADRPFATLEKTQAQTSHPAFSIPAPSRAGLGSETIIEIAAEAMTPYQDHLDPQTLEAKQLALEGYMLRFAKTDSVQHLADYYQSNPAYTALPPITEAKLAELTRQQMLLFAEFAAIGLTGFIPPACENYQFLRTAWEANGATKTELVQLDHHQRYQQTVVCPDDVRQSIRSVTDDISQGRIAFVPDLPNVMCDIGDTHAMVKGQVPTNSWFGVPTISFAMTVNDHDVVPDPMDSSDMPALLYRGVRAQHMLDQPFGDTIVDHGPYKEHYTGAIYDHIAADYDARLAENRFGIATRFPATFQKPAVSDFTETVTYLPYFAQSTMDAMKANPTFQTAVKDVQTQVQQGQWPTPDAVETLMNAAKARDAH